MKIVHVGICSAVLTVALMSLVSSSALAETSYQRLKSFGYPDQAGTLPHSALIFGKDGALYGTTQLGGADNQGTVFKLNPDGTRYTVLHSFSAGGDGKNPIGALLQGQDGLLYGNTVFGGTNGYGSSFRLDTNGSSYTVLHHFSTNTLDGQYPYGRLIQDANGVLYGSASAASTDGAGCVFRMNADGSGFTSLHLFPANGFEGGFPRSVILGQDGLLYGNTQGAGISSTGKVFRLQVDGGNFTILTNLLRCGRNRAHQNALFQTSDGGLFGTTCYSLVTEVLFKVSTNNGSYTALHTFATNAFDGFNPDTQLIQGFDGALYGTTINGGTNRGGTVFKINSDGTGYTSLYCFSTNGVDGRAPTDALVQGADGRLYGTTLLGGANNEGTVYAINTNGSAYTLLRSFSHFANDGQNPSGALTEGDDDCLYGTTYNGGSSNCGTIFRIGQDGSYSNWHDFRGAGDGQQPSGKLLRGSDGAWYGTTFTGGNSNSGTIFRLSSDGNAYSLLYSFKGLADGESPSDALVQGTNGALYGTAAAGGTNGVGTVFELNLDGQGFTVLHTFLTNGVDGASPAGGLLVDSNGFLYGTSESGGSANAGAVFKLAQDGSSYLLLHSFETNGADGTLPGAGLIMGRDGCLYGTTLYGGANGQGTVFRLKTDGSGYTVLQNLSDTGLSGRELSSQLVQGSDGTLYGSAYHGGPTNINGGVLFELSTNGNGFTATHAFGATAGDGLFPSGPLFSHPEGGWYGVTEGGGDLGLGTLYFVPGFPPALASPLQNQSLTNGTSASFNLGAIGGPTYYQWLFNGAPLPGENSPTLALPVISRARGGVYALLVTNAFGSVMSSNATLSVQVPLHVSAPLMHANAFQFDAAYSDGFSLLPEDLNRFEVKVSSDLINWVTLPDVLSISEGKLILNDSGTTNSSTRFYRVIEHQ